MNTIAHKFREVVLAVLPVTIMVLLLNFTLTPLGLPLLIRFMIGALLIILGLTVFLFGVDIGITPIGNIMGNTIAKSNKVILVIISGLILGFVVSIAEPDLHILANQVSLVTSGAVSKLSIVIVVSIGIAVMLATGLLRILYNYPLFKLLTGIYLVILILSMLTPRDFLAISFDASGATTGALTVPFILAIGIGVSNMKKDSKASEKDSFGLVAIASTGAILSTMMVSILSKSSKLGGSIELAGPDSSSLVSQFALKMPHISLEVFIALAPLFLIYVASHFVGHKFEKRAFIKVFKGMIYTYIGLVLFLTGVNGSFLDVGALVGYKLASLNQPYYLVLVGAVLGIVTILAEPAVYVLTKQIEDVTSGYVRRQYVMVALSLGVGLSVGLSMIRVLVYEIQLWHYLLPGYVIAVLLMFVVPKLFIGIAYDSGGVASGPMTATFILAFAQGAAENIAHADVLVDGFGMIAMVALTPLITIQILGLMYKLKSGKGGIQ
ncbi:MAG TPA: DUF1538 domain-containing protein [Clostridiales bacterium UBA8960]|nr:DUF1538 domain-containing protein [Clostridiales bacterium UBA8960]